MPSVLIDRRISTYGYAIAYAGVIALFAIIVDGRVTCAPFRLAICRVPHLSKPDIPKNCLQFLSSEVLTKEDDISVAGITKKQLYKIQRAQPFISWKFARPYRTSRSGGYLVS